MIGGANYFDCGPNGNGVILDFNPAKGDTKSPDCKYVITTYSNNIFGPGIPNVFPGPGLFSGQNLNQNGVNNTGGVAGLSSSHQPNIAGLMGMLSGQNSNANEPNIAGLMGMLSGQNSNANEPNIAGLMGMLSGQNSNHLILLILSVPIQTPAKLLLWEKVIHHGDYQVKSS
jgi:hypothetical protein